MNEVDTKELTSLFQETGQAHHNAFAETDGADPDWPLWYADHMQESFNKTFGASLTKSELVYLLVGVEKERGQRAPGSHWPRYYAKFFIERYS